MKEPVVLTDLLRASGFWVQDRSDLAPVQPPGPQAGTVVTLVRSGEDESLPYMCFAHDREMPLERAGAYLAKITYGLAHPVG